MPPDELVRTHAREKARSVAAAPGDGPVIGVDTAVVLDDDTVLGKPPDAAAARGMLERLAGRPHRVLSGLAVRADGRELVEHAATASAGLPSTVSSDSTTAVSTPTTGPSPGRVATERAFSSAWVRTSSAGATGSAGSS